MLLKNRQYYRPTSAFFKEVLGLRDKEYTIAMKDIASGLSRSHTALSIIGIAICVFLIIVSLTNWWQEVRNSTQLCLLVVIFGGLGSFVSSISDANDRWELIGKDLHALHSLYPKLHLTGRCLPGMIQEINQAKHYIGEDLARRTGQIIAKQRHGLRHDAYVEKEELEGRIEFLLRMNLTKETLNDRFLGHS